jgi:hypothetical protein
MARNARAPQEVEEPARHVNRNLLIVGALLAVTAAGWWALRSSPDRPVGDEEARTALEAAPDSTQATGPGAAKVAAPPAVAAGESADADPQFQRYVDDKYRLLMRDVEGASLAALRAALLAREQVVVQINTARQSGDPAARQTLPALEARKAALDRDIGRLLPPGELTMFDVLKDADIERFQVDDYAAGISNVAPLSEADKQSVLATKLVYRQRFRRVLDDSRLMTGDLNGTERLLAFTEVSRALKEYQQSYLQEVRQYLYNDEQYTLLSNYETSEYDAELAKLRVIAGLE